VAGPAGAGPLGRQQRPEPGPLGVGQLHERGGEPLEGGGGGRLENAHGGVYTAAGKEEPERWGQRAMWCDCAGSVDGQVVGVCLMDHPTNPRYPTHWHARGDGLLAANPFGLHDFFGDPDPHRGDWTIPAAESRAFAYRVLVHRGGTAEADVRTRYHDFVNPPTVTLASSAAPRRPTAPPGPARSRS
jgi:hypothetical protein